MQKILDDAGPFVLPFAQPAPAATPRPPPPAPPRWVQPKLEDAPASAARRWVASREDARPFREPVAAAAANDDEAVDWEAERAPRRLDWLFAQAFPGLTAQGRPGGPGCAALFARMDKVRLHAAPGAVAVEERALYCQFWCCMQRQFARRAVTVSDVPMWFRCEDFLTDCFWFELLFQLVLAFQQLQKLLRAASEALPPLTRLALQLQGCHAYLLEHGPGFAHEDTAAAARGLDALAGEVRAQLLHRLYLAAVAADPGFRDAANSECVLRLFPADARRTRRLREAACLLDALLDQDFALRRAARRGPASRAAYAAESLDMGYLEPRKTVLDFSLEGLRLASHLELARGNCVEALALLLRGPPLRATADRLVAFLTPVYPNIEASARAMLHRVEPPRFEEPFLRADDPTQQPLLADLEPRAPTQLAALAGRTRDATASDEDEDRPPVQFHEEA